MEVRSLIDGLVRIKPFPSGISDKPVQLLLHPKCFSDDRQNFGFKSAVQKYRVHLDKGLTDQIKVDRSIQGTHRWDAFVGPSNLAIQPLKALSGNGQGQVGGGSVTDGWKGRIH